MEQTHFHTQSPTVSLKIESVTALLIFWYLLVVYRINTDVVMTHDFPLSHYEEVSYIQDEQQTFQTKEINISDYSLQYSSLFDICISVNLHW